MVMSDLLRVNHGKFNFIEQFHKLLVYYDMLELGESELAERTGLSVSNAKKYRNAKQPTIPLASVIDTLAYKFGISHLFFYSNYSVEEWNKLVAGLKDEHFAKLVQNIKELPDFQKIAITSMLKVSAATFQFEVKRETDNYGSKEENAAKIERKMILNSKRSLNMDLTSDERKFLNMD